MQLTIRIGAAVDRSLSEAYRPLLAGAEKLRVGVEKSAKGAADAQVRAQKRVADSADREYAKAKATIDRWAAENARAADRAAKAREAAAARAARAEAREAEKATRTQEREDQKRARSAERAHAAAERTAAREARSRDRQRVRAQRVQDRGNVIAAREFRKSVGNVASGVGSHLMGAGRMAGSFALDLARDVAAGAGVDLDLGSMMRKNSELETKSTELANSGYMAGDARNGKRIEARELMGDALKVGKETGVDANSAIEGLIKFAGKTGDLATGREILKDLAIYSKATGTSLDDMVDAAGDVSSALGDVPNKGQKINLVMKAVAGQGKLGAVEIKNLASQMAKLAANATQIEGDVSDNIVLMGAFAQEARQRGGASSATMAATSVASLVNTFKTPARAKEFKAATGKDVFTKEGMLRNPETLVMEALKAKGMDPLGFKKIFANVQGARAVEGFATIYRQAGGGKAGEKAVREEFERLKKAVVSDTEVLESFRRSLITSEAQANIFNNTMRETAMKLQDTLQPTLLELAPRFAEMAKVGANVVDWLIGADARARQSQNRVDAQVGAAHGETEKQIKSGYVFKEQLAINADTEKAAFENMNRAKAEASVLNKDADYSGFTKSALRFADKINPGTYLGNRVSKWFGGNGTQGGGQMMIDAKDKEITERTDRATAAEAKWDEIHKTNQRVADLLAQGIIQVRVVEDNTKKPGDGKGFDQSGRDSGEKPR